MGQTLNHGIYLPAEGERNCYSGLASNWNLLDTAIGDIAGKASATHTHGNITNDGKVGTDANKPLITGTDGVVQAGSFGTSANTFCEGNDSRLSDARTPVAHTHTKSDVTDLFNSANTWSGENKYTSGFILSNISWSGVTPPSSAKPTIIEFKNSDTRQGRYINRIGVNTAETWIETIRNVDANTSHNFTVIMQVDNSGNKKLLPYNSDADLGQSTSQSTGRWKTLNGVNPGALSLPDYSHPIFLDVTTQGLNWHTDATPNFYTIPANGYFAVIVQCPNISNGVLDIFVNNTGIGSSGYGTYAGSELFCYVPVIQGQIVRVRARCDNYYSVTFYPCLGNV